MISQPLALTPALPSELLAYILAHQAYPTTVIICQPRASFLDSLLECISRPIAQIPSPKDGNAEAAIDEPPAHHPLLIPTLHQVTTSRYINLVFVQSLSHLRAYLTVFPRNTDEALPLQAFENPGKNKPLLLIYGLVELHRDTSEWSAQGLGNTLATLVEAGNRSGKSIVVTEERKTGDEPDYFHGDEEMTEEEAIEGKKRELVRGWEEEVPILNGGVRKGRGAESEGGWSGRTVGVGRILGRWFNFGREDWGNV